MWEEGAPRSVHGRCVAFSACPVEARASCARTGRQREQQRVPCVQAGTGTGREKALCCMAKRFLRVEGVQRWLLVPKSACSECRSGWPQAAGSP